jgi:hypothetical protein
MWSMVIPWLCRPLNPFEDVINDEVIMDRNEDRKKFNAMSLFWLRADEVIEIFRKYLPEMYEAYATNIARIDLDYDDDVNEAVSDLQCVGYLKYPVKVRVKLQSLTETNRW